MGTIPVGPTFVAGQKLTAANLNAMNDVAAFWALTPRCSVYQTTTATSFATGTATVVGFDAELFDIVQSGDTPSHDTATNNSRLVVRTAGKYEITGQVMFAPNATGVRVAQVRMNAAGSAVGGTQIAQTSQGATPSGSASVPITTIEVPMAVGDYIEMFGTQTSGVTLASNTGQANTFLRIKLTGS